jgi:hypothetical protein
VRIDLVNSLVAAIGDPNSAFAYTDALIFTRTGKRLPARAWAL